MSTYRWRRTPASPVRGFRTLLDVIIAGSAMRDTCTATGETARRTPAQKAARLPIVPVRSAGDAASTLLITVWEERSNVRKTRDET